jgi:roadblock/LC7 domain-containing protein
MAYTTQQLSDLEAAIAAGTLRVSINGRMVEYRSLADMKTLRDEIRAELGVATNTARRGRAWYPTPTKGYD